MQNTECYDFDINWLASFNPDWIINSFNDIANNPDNAKSIIDDLFGKTVRLQSTMREFTKKVCGKDRTPADYASFKVIKSTVAKYNKDAEDLDEMSNLTFKILMSVQLMDMLVEQNFEDSKLVSLTLETFDTILSKCANLPRTKVSFGIRFQDLNEMLFDANEEKMDDYDEFDEEYDGDEIGEEISEEEVMKALSQLLSQNPKDFENSLNEIFGEKLKTKTNKIVSDLDNIIKFKNK